MQRKCNCTLESHITFIENQELDQQKLSNFPNRINKSFSRKGKILEVIQIGTVSITHCEETIIIDT